MAKKSLTDAAEALKIQTGKASQKAKAKTEKQFTKAKFKKPASDYYRLDLITRQQDGHGKMIEDIKTDYKAYISTMARAEGMSITKYIHKLLDADMKKNNKRYEELQEIISK